MKELDKTTFYPTLSENSRLNVVCFWGMTCANCKAFLPKYQAFSEEKAKLANFYRFNATENPAISIEQRVRTLPTVLVFRGETQLQRFSGRIDREELEAALYELDRDRPESENDNCLEEEK